MDQNPVFWRQRVFAFLLTFALLFSLMGGSASAAEKTGEEAAPVFAEADSAAMPLTVGEVEISSRIFDILFGKEEAPKRETKKEVYVGGMLFGIEIANDGLTVTEAEGDTPFKVGDVLFKMNGKDLSSSPEARKLVAESGGEEMEIVLRRDGKMTTILYKPQEKDGEYKLGILLRDGTAGIGTVTYFDTESGEYGGLGHGIGDPDSGELVGLRAGSATGVILGGAERGIPGRPGELRGVLDKAVYGSVTKNCDCGVFGRLLPGSVFPYAGAEKVTVGGAEDLHEGTATVRSTVRGGAPCDYEIEIVGIDRKSEGSKSFTVKVTDPMLIALTGGIVRGMSGSPILQDGKLVGALTHVMIGNPTEGYGIFIENMLDAAGSAETTVGDAA